MTWTALWSDIAKKQLKKLPKKDQKRILDKTEDVESEPYRYIIRLSGEPVYRYRVGDYRIIVNLVKDQLLIQIIKVKKRGRVYGKY